MASVGLPANGTTQYAEAMGKGGLTPFSHCWAACLRQCVRPLRSAFPLFSMCSKIPEMRKKRDIRQSAQNTGSPLMAYVIVLLFFVCFLILLWVLVVGARFLVG